MKKWKLTLLLLGIGWVSWAQNISRVEYFFDKDPGHGNGIEITGYPLASTALADYVASIDGTSLNQGLHNLFIRIKYDNNKWSVVQNHLFLKQNAQSIGNITRLEYFFDKDPGHGNGTEITGYTAGTDVVNLSASINASALSQGLHTLFVRSKDDWSITNQQLFLKQDVPTLGNITRLEYFFDTDPGHGNGTEITGYTAGTDVINLTANINATSLSQGLHTLFVRSKDDWSITNQQLFLKQDVPSLGNITRLEYFFDTDPGHGNGTEITGYTAGTDVVNLSASINATSLSQGLHTLFVRSKDDWSITNQQLFLKQDVPSLGNITRLEYFFDTDPGHGNGTEITGYAVGTDVVNLSASINATALSQGLHTLFVRSKDDWSITNQQLFLKKDVPTLGNITRLEYFFDTDPGHGNGTEITGYTAGTDVVNLSANINASALSQGLHTLFVRSKDDWSITNQQLFLKQDVPTLTNITAFEYFFDKDPGAGNGTPLMVSPNTNIANQVYNLDFTSLSNGQHYLFVRTKNADGEWSITQANLINKDVSAPLPLNWLSFEVKLNQNQTTNMLWATASEINTSHFEVQKSTNGKEFFNIGQLKSSNKNTKNEYQFLDQNTTEGIIYYRIKQVDLDGKFSYSAIKQLVVEGKRHFVVKNNPSDSPTIVIEAKRGALLIFDATGVLLTSKNVNKGDEIAPLINQNTGIYLAVFSLEGQVIATQKIVKNR